MVEPAVLERVRELNYDHHRRMTELHNQRVSTGENEVISTVDDQSYRTLLQIIPKNRKAVLELGSASGGQWGLLREWAPDGSLTGIDLFEPMVTKARACGLHIELGYVEKMDCFSDASFDLVCSRHVMEHLGDVDAGIREIRRVLMVGGYSAHVTPDMAFDNEPAHLNKWKLRQWKLKWEAHGFRVAYAAVHPFHGGETHLVMQKGMLPGGFP